jgi:hypothetical protein
MSNIRGPRQLSRYSDWLRAGRSGIESRWGRFFSHASRPALEPTQPPVQWIPGLFRGLSGRGVVLTTHPCSSDVKKEQNYTSLPPLGLRFCYGVTSN